MFDLVAKHKRLLQVFLAILIIPPFAFWGIDSYQGNSTQVNEVASVDGSRITEQEFTDQLRGQLVEVSHLRGRHPADRYPARDVGRHGRLGDQPIVGGVLTGRQDREQLGNARVFVHGTDGRRAWYGRPSTL